jgi:Raf kinase inhibitor-like YbhB/YbcL family protein
MRVAYALLGIAFAVVFGAGYLLVERAYAPVEGLAPLPTPPMFTLSSSAFKNGERIPADYTCDGTNINPPLSIRNAPQGTGAFVLVVEDPDIPEAVKERLGVDVFDHWILTGIASSTEEIPAGTSGGTNQSGSGYTGPCPPSEYEPREHRYVFTLYALSSEPQFIKAPTKQELLTAIESTTIAKAFLVGRYERTASPTP